MSIISINMGHSQAWVKVNAPVDEGVRGIIEALSAFPKLETIESCEGDSIKGPWVCFRYGSYWDDSGHELSNFVLGFLGKNLMALVGDDALISIQVLTSGNLMAELSVRHGAAPRIEAALKELLRDFSAFQRHNSEYCDDTSDTSL